MFMLRKRTRPHSSNWFHQPYICVVIPPELVEINTEIIEIIVLSNSLYNIDNLLVGGGECHPLRFSVNRHDYSTLR